MEQVPPEIRDAMVRADMELVASGTAQRALKAGDRAPDFNLTDARDGYVRLKDPVAAGPVVLSFYQGGWRPYCNLELRALQHVLPDKKGDETWVLPIPATYVIDKDGTIALAFVDVDYRNRLEPAEILTALRSLSKEQRGKHHANASR